MKNNKKISSIICISIAVFLIIIGVVFGIIGIVFDKVFDRVDEEIMTEQSKGEIVDVIYNGDTSYAMIEYIANGEVFTIKSHFSSSSFQVGDECVVHYNPKNKKDAVMEIPQALKITIKVFTYIGLGGIAIAVILILIAISLLVSAKRQKNKRIKPF